MSAPIQPTSGYQTQLQLVIMRLTIVMLSTTSHSTPMSTLPNMLSTAPSHGRYSRPVQALSWTRGIRLLVDTSIPPSPSHTTSSRNVSSIRSRVTSSLPTTSCSSYAIITSTRRRGRRRGLFAHGLRSTTVWQIFSSAMRTQPVTSYRSLSTLRWDRLSMTFGMLARSVYWSSACRRKC